MTTLCETCLPSFAAELRLAVERAEKAEALASHLARGSAALLAEIRAARALGDELAEALDLMLRGVLSKDVAVAALAKWEASRG